MAKALRLDCTLFRRDNAKSVCLIHDAILEISTCMVDRMAYNASACYGWNDVAFANSDIGRIAQSLIE